MLGFPHFTPAHSLLGGLMLSSSVNALLSNCGMVLGISGFFHSTVRSCLVASSDQSQQAGGVNEQAKSESTAKRVGRLFTFGLVLGGVLLSVARSWLESPEGLAVPLFDPLPASLDYSKQAGGSLLAVLAPTLFNGLLVGFGTKLGSGCTSGHFLCGLSRLSPRSIVATATFFGVAVLTHLSSHPAAVNVTLDSAASALPSLAALAALQLPALVYTLIVPRLSPSSHELASSLIGFATGLHFAFGLALTGMLRPSKVLGFLSLSPARISSGEWDPSLALVAVGGILPASALWFSKIKSYVARQQAVKLSDDANSDEEQQRLEAKPRLHKVAPRWRVPTSKTIDWKLVTGAAIFGLGWGRSGFCPGPVLTNLGANVVPSLLETTTSALPSLVTYSAFTLAMALGGLAAASV